MFNSTRSEADRNCDQPCGKPDPVSCVHDHWSNTLGVGPSPIGSNHSWRGRCPVCGTRDTLKINVKPNVLRPVWRVFCTCPREVVHKALSAACPCVPPLSKPRVQENPRRQLSPMEAQPAKAKDVPAISVRSLATNKNLTGTALRVTLLMATGMSENEAMNELGIIHESNRSRTRKQRRDGLTKPAGQPGKGVKTDNPEVIKIDNPVIKIDNPEVIKMDNPVKGNVNQENTIPAARAGSGEELNSCDTLTLWGSVSSPEESEEKVLHRECFSCHKPDWVWGDEAPSVKAHLCPECMRNVDALNAISVFNEGRMVA